MHVQEAPGVAQSRRPFILRRLVQQDQVQQELIRKQPQWQRAWMGYFLTIPLTLLASLLIALLQSVGYHFYFPSGLMLLLVVLEAVIWGVGPALLTVLLSTLALDYLYIAPLNTFNMMTLDAFLQLFPFGVSGLIVAFLTAQREAGRRKTLIAEKEAERRATALAAANARLSEANRELEESNRLKDQFLSMASHELKTPITTIRGQAQVMIRRLTRMPDLPSDLLVVRDSLGKIDQQTHRLNLLVDDLLDLNRIRSGKLAFRIAQTDVVAICREVVLDQELLSERHIEMELPNQPILAPVDAERLSQVMVNLVSNALKYSEKENMVDVRVWKEDQTIRIRVRNAGSFIPQEQLSQIFELFYRTPEAAKSEKKGSGLGLAISKAIVDGHQGKIWCESDKRTGTSFFVEIPL